MYVIHTCNAGGHESDSGLAYRESFEEIALATVLEEAVLFQSFLPVCLRWISGQRCSLNVPGDLCLVPRIHLKVDEKTNPTMLSVVRPLNSTSAVTHTQ